MHEFAREVMNFLNEVPSNVVAIHCKGGKGRTGLMICAYLLYSGYKRTAKEALDYFEKKRTAGEGKRQGVTGPSQIRYVHYYEKGLCILKYIIALLNDNSSPKSTDKSSLNLINKSLPLKLNVRMVQLTQIIIEYVLFNIL